ncbi:MAG: choline-sulfatase [Acidimicrobiales bacterium]
MTGPGEQPNILLLMADQLGAPYLAPYGGPAVAPAIDRLAEEGTVFESAYSNSPLCAPARFAMMAGQLNSRIGAYDNASEFVSSVPTFAHHLRRGGYQTSLIGKMHFVGADQLHGYEERLTTDIYPADFGWTPNWADPETRLDWWFHNLDSVVHAGVAEASNQLDFDDEVGFRTVAKLRDLARSDDKRPWFVTASFTHPHDPYVARRQFWDRYDPESVPLPEIRAVDDPDPHSRRLAHLMAADTTTVTDDQVRTARHAYLANISYVDHFVDQIMATLDRLDMRSNTVVLFTADHGDMLGERGLWYKMNFFEHSARVPLIINAPGRVPSGRANTVTSLLDIAPTLLDLAGLTIPDLMDGASLLGLIDAPDPERTVVGEFMGEGAIAPIIMIRRGHEKFVWCRTDPPQLYDLVADPHELTNLADHPTHVDQVAGYREEINRRWDLDDLERSVLASQQARSTVDQALRQGRFTSWDHQPSTDAAAQYMRNHLDLNQVERSRRV